MTELTNKGRKGWPKGVSGNPGGKRKGQPNLTTVIDDVLAKPTRHGRSTLYEVIYRLVDIAVNAEKDSDAIQAADKLLTRRYGAPTQHIKTEGTVAHVDLTREYLEVLRSYAQPATVIEHDGNNISQTDENIATSLRLIDATPIDEQDQ